MYILFQTAYPQVTTLGYETYRHIFNNEFNIAFGDPRKDTCSTCDELVLKIQHTELKIAEAAESEQCQYNRELEKLVREHDLHKRRAETFYTNKREAKARAKQSGTSTAFAFDYQKNL